jgi:hypothetical protein
LKAFFVKNMYRSCKDVLSSIQRNSHAHASKRRTDFTSLKAVVSVACSQHLPSATPARSAHPHST